MWAIGTGVVATPEQAQARRGDLPGSSSSGGGGGGAAVRQPGRLPLQLPPPLPARVGRTACSAQAVPLRSRRRTADAGAPPSSGCAPPVPAAGGARLRAQVGVRQREPRGRHRPAHPLRRLGCAAGAAREGRAGRWPALLRRAGVGVARGGLAAAAAAACWLPTSPRAVPPPAAVNDKNCDTLANLEDVDGFLVSAPPSLPVLLSVLLGWAAGCGSMRRRGGGSAGGVARLEDAGGCLVGACGGPGPSRCRRVAPFLAGGLRTPLPAAEGWLLQARAARPCWPPTADPSPTRAGGRRLAGGPHLHQDLQRRAQALVSAPREAAGRGPSSAAQLCAAAALESARAPQPARARVRARRCCVVERPSAQLSRWTLPPFSPRSPWPMLCSAAPTVSVLHPCFHYLSLPPQSPFLCSLALPAAGLPWRGLPHDSSPGRTACTDPFSSPPNVLTLAGEPAPPAPHQQCRLQSSAVRAGHGRLL